MAVTFSVKLNMCVFDNANMKYVSVSLMMSIGNSRDMVPEYEMHLHL